MDQSPRTVEFAPLWSGDRFGEDHALCIEFVNTVSWRGRPNPVERLNAPDEWLDWIEANRALPSEALSELRRRAGMWSFEAEAGFKRAIEFREAVYALLDGAIAGQKSPEKSALDDVLSRAFERLRLEHEGDSWRWAFDASAVDWETPLYPVALSAAQLLTSEWLAKLRACGRDECRWLFLDLTKNHSRKWCDMASCGNVMKARRSYARKKGGTTVRRARSGSPLR